MSLIEKWPYTPRGFRTSIGLKDHAAFRKKLDAGVLSISTNSSNSGDENNDCGQKQERDGRGR